MKKLLEKEDNENIVKKKKQFWFKFLSETGDCVVSLL